MLDDATRTRSRELVVDANARVPTATILWHSSARRVGEQAKLVDLAFGGSVRLGRDAPLFGLPDGPESRPLEERSVSRSAPLVLRRVDGGIALSGAKPGKVSVEGQPLLAELVLRDSQLESGVVLCLSYAVALVLRLQEQLSPADEMGMVGQSDAIRRIRLQVAKVANRDVNVLVQGETGTGKELVARAIHDQSERRRRPFVAVSMADIPPQLVASDLFGHVRGAFTGATSDSPGRFGQADRGTLFMDEIALAPLELQAALLRVLETGMVQAVGASRPRQVDVRVVAATDGNMERAVAEGRFLAPLLYRLRSYELWLPPLRQRREDVGSILSHFLRLELGREGREAQLERLGDAEPWLPALLVAELARHELPGNVRDLRTAAQRLVIDFAADNEVRLESAAPLLGGGGRRATAPLAPPSSALPPPPSSDTTPAAPPAPATTAFANGGCETPPRAPIDLTTSELLEALERGKQSPDRAARFLGISRTTLYRLMRERGLVIAAQLTATDIRRHLEEQRGDVGGAARALRVSERALLARVRSLADATLSALIQRSRR